ncbi:MAG TPA: acyl-CoA acyltransferase [Xanthobacteraceae bacterium]|nr:acyl-CoA acyltransferase [Xanthobacteraceae bacterium]
MLSPAPPLRCRQIGEADIAAVATLLARGFHKCDRRFWLHAFAQLARREPPPGLPKYGYLMESAGVPVGAILLICATMPAGDRAAARCNLSSWYVEPSFRPYAPLLVSQALRRKDVTYLNVSPAPHTRSIIEAQGFARYCDGVFVAVPMLQGLFGGERVKIVRVPQQPEACVDPFEQQVLLQHAALGCISLWCATSEAGYPFVFRPRLVKGIIPCAQLIYCRDMADFVRFAGPIGRFLALRGCPLVIADANGRIRGLLGAFRRGSAPKYFKGPQRPRLGDLAYTESALLGV